MQPQRTPDSSEQVTLCIEYPHDNATVKFALDRAVPVNRTAAEVSVRPEKPARGRVLVRKRGIHKQVPLVFIDLGYKRRARRDRLSRKRKWPELLFDHNIVAQVHATFTALAAGKPQKIILAQLSRMRYLKKTKSGIA
jgi:hypothetical protein